jgi:hypothetical protein
MFAGGGEELEGPSVLFDAMGAMSSVQRHADPRQPGL